MYKKLIGASVIAIVIICCVFSLCIGYYAYFIYGEEEICQIDLNSNITMRVEKQITIVNNLHLVNFKYKENDWTEIAAIYSNSDDFRLSYGTTFIDPNSSRHCTQMPIRSNANRVLIGNRFISFDSGENIFDWDTYTTSLFRDEINPYLSREYPDIASRYTYFTNGKVSMNDSGFIGEIELYETNDKIAVVYIDIKANTSNLTEFKYFDFEVIDVEEF